MLSERKSQSGSCWYSLPRDSGPPSFLNYKIIALPGRFSGREMVSVKPPATCCVVCEVPGQSYSEQGDTFPLLGLHPWDCPTVGIRERGKERVQRSPDC